ncbi:hypothetical protein BH11PSE11_BH11PSE11_23020 [soil metagenome]
MESLEHLDVTKRINLADPHQVCLEVCDLLCAENPAVDTVLITRAFDIFSQLYSGTLDGYHSCETLYHDIHHVLDVTLACARMLAGHEQAEAAESRLGSERLTLGIVVSLFHDAGYIRRRQDRTCWHGAQYTLRHVARGARFLSHFLIEEGHVDWARRAVKLIHFTGYEMPIDQIRIDDPLDRRLGCMIGTADLIAQMSDRVYLEKCRDYLYEEFELGGLTRQRNADGSIKVVYDSSLDLLSKTPAFYSSMVRKRLDEEFGQSYRNLEVLFDGHNPYLDGLARNMSYLQQLLDDGSLGECLRRKTEPVLGAIDFSI